MAELLRAGQRGGRNCATGTHRPTPRGPATIPARAAAAGNGRSATGDCRWRRCPVRSWRRWVPDRGTRRLLAFVQDVGVRRLTNAQHCARATPNAPGCRRHQPDPAIDITKVRPAEGGSAWVRTRGTPPPRSTSADWQRALRGRVAQPTRGACSGGDQPAARLGHAHGPQDHLAVVHHHLDHRGTDHHGNEGPQPAEHAVHRDFFGIAMEPAVNHLHMKRGMRARGCHRTGVPDLRGVPGRPDVHHDPRPGERRRGVVEQPQIRHTEDQRTVRHDHPDVEDRSGVQPPPSRMSRTGSRRTPATSWVSPAPRSASSSSSSRSRCSRSTSPLMLRSIRRAILRKFAPGQQQRLGWAWDTAIEQTGGYLYSRLLLMIINGGLFFFACCSSASTGRSRCRCRSSKGSSPSSSRRSVPTSVLRCPIVLTWGLNGLTAALILLGWTLIYQQLENYFLSPKISARTMEINGGIAFGAAMAGGCHRRPDAGVHVLAHRRLGHVVHEELLPQATR